MVFELSIKTQGGAQNKGSRKMWSGLNLHENLRASPFNKNLSNETTFSLIHLAKQSL
jgi:hypothetical protein